MMYGSMPDLGQIIAIAGNYACHQVMVPTQIFRRTVVNNVRAMLQWPLQVRAHHCIVYHDDSILAFLLDQGANCGNIANLE